MRIHHLLLLCPAMLSGCLPVMCSLPIVAKDSIWDDAAPVTEISGRSVTVDGATTQIAGLDISGLSDSERHEFDAALAEMLRGKDVLVQPVSPGVSRLWIAGEPVYLSPKYMACAPAIPVFIPHIAPARPDRIDVAERLLSAGLAHAAREESERLPRLPARSNVFFVPEFPLRLGQKANIRLDPMYESVEEDARSRRVGMFAAAADQPHDEPVASLRQEGHYASGSLPDFE